MDGGGGHSCVGVYDVYAGMHAQSSISSDSSGGDSSGRRARISSVSVRQQEQQNAMVFNTRSARALSRLCACRGLACKM